MNDEDTKTQRVLKPFKDWSSEEMERVARGVVNAAFSVHMSLGPGLLESVYELCLARELELRGYKIERQVCLPIQYADLDIPSGLRLDIVVEDCVIVELKAVEEILPVHKAQLLTYLKLSGYRLGFLINFNVPLIKQGIRRMIL